MKNEKETPLQTEKSSEGSASYPFYTIEGCVPRMKQIAARYGVGGQPAPRKEICTLLGKAEPTLMNFFSACFQYKLLENTPSKGVIVTELFQKIEEGDKAASIIAMNNPPIYKKLIEVYNNKGLPDEEGLAKLFTSKEYGVHSNTASRAAKIFFENGRSLGIIDANNRLRYLMPTAPAKPKDDSQGGGAHDNPPPPDIKTPKVFDFPIDLTGDKMAYLRYPKGHMTASDINMMEIMIKAAIAALRASIGESKNENEGK